MKTQVIKIDPLNINPALIQEAADVIKRGGLVAFPTETVYGLGGAVFNREALKKIFKAKKRPLNDPLIVHIADKKDLQRVAGGIPEIALDLIGEFWPGPLTLVLKRLPAISPMVSAGLETIAVRMPDNPVALSLIRASETPIAAPSANLFSRPSPTRAGHVWEDLASRIDLILDSGGTEIGLESTILDLSALPYRILRPGGLSLEDLRGVIPDIGLYQGDGILSSGMFGRHYSPKARIILVENNEANQPEKAQGIASKYIAQGYKTGIMAKDENKQCYNKDFTLKTLGPENNLKIYASNLFKTLRDFDSEGVQVIVAEGVSEKGIGRAIMDRLRKASAK